LDWTLLEESFEVGVEAIGSRLEELTGEDDVVGAVGIGDDGRQPILSCSLTNTSDKLVLDNVRLLLYLLCDLTSNIARLDAASIVGNLTFRPAKAAHGGDVRHQHVVDELLHYLVHSSCVRQYYVNASERSKDESTHIGACIDKSGV